MFKELLSAKRKYYGQAGWYPTAVQMTEATWEEIKLEGKALSMKASHGFSPTPVRGAVGSVNGMLVFLKDGIELFNFGFFYEDGFSKEVF